MYCNEFFSGSFWEVVHGAFIQGLAVRCHRPFDQQFRLSPRRETDAPRKQRDPATDLETRRVSGEDLIAAANNLAKFGSRASAAVPKLIERVEKDLIEKGLHSATEALCKIGAVSGGPSEPTHLGDVSARAFEFEAFRVGVVLETDGGHPCLRRG